MESSTKERLTGALLVVLAVVVVAPELFSGRRTGEQGAPPAQNPEDGAPLQTYNIQLDASSAPAVPRDVPAAAAEVAAVPPPVTQDTPVSVVPAAAAPVDKPIANGDGPPAASKPAAARPVAPVVAPADPWWVQVGSFESGDNAQRLAKKLRAAGFAIEVARSRTKGKDLYRVRAGPVADRAAATELRARLAVAGEKNSSLVAP